MSFAKVDNQLRLHLKHKFIVLELKWTPSVEDYLIRYW